MQDIGTKGKAGMEGIKVQGENKGKITQEGGINQMGTSAAAFCRLASSLDNRES